MIEIGSNIKNATKKTIQHLITNDKLSEEVMDAKFFVEPDLLNPSPVTTSRIKKNAKHKITENLKKSQAVNFFRKLYAGNTSSKKVFANINRECTRKEVEKAIDSSPNCKSAGPDGIPYELFKKCKDFFVPF